MPMGMPRSSDELATLLWDAEYRPTTIAPDVHGQRRERQRGKCIRIASIAPDDATILLHHANSGRMEFSERTVGFRPRFLSRVSATVVPRSEAGGARGAASSGDPWDHPRLYRQQTLALQLFAGELAGTADGLRLLPPLSFGWFFVMTTERPLAEDAPA